MTDPEKELIFEQGADQKSIDKFFDECSKLKQTSRYSLNLQMTPDQCLQKLTSAIIKKHKPNLTKLSVYMTGFTLDAWKMFSSVKWPALKTISIYDCPIGDEEALLFSKINAPQLEEILLIECNISDAGAQSISTGKWEKLTEFAFDFRNSSVAGASKLANAHWKNLQVFEFHCLKIEQQSVHAIHIPQLLNFPSLDVLKFYKCQIPQQFLDKINKLYSPNLKKLFSFDCPVTAPRLFKSNEPLGWQNISEVSFGSNFVRLYNSVPDMTSFCEYPLRKLSTLSLLNIRLSKQASRQFLKAEWALTFLSIFNCELGPEDFKIVTKCQWSSLDEIVLRGNRILDSGFQSIYLAHWTNIKKISLEECQNSGHGLIGLVKIRSSKLQAADVSGSYVRENQIKSLTSKKDFLPFEITQSWGG